MNSNSHLLVSLHLLTEKLIFLILSVLLMKELFCSFVVVITFSRILRQNGMEWSQNGYNLTYLVGILIILYIFIDI